MGVIDLVVEFVRPSLFSVQKDKIISQRTQRTQRNIEGVFDFSLCALRPL